MTDAELLEMTKANLQIISGMTGNDSYITMLIQAAKKEIGREGITLSSDENGDVDDVGDCNLVVMYASYLYRARNYIAPTADASNNKYFATTSNNAGQMPRMLRYALNNRLFQQKMAEDETQ